jgi:hypothetical protein
LCNARRLRLNTTRQTNHQDDKAALDCRINGAPQPPPEARLGTGSALQHQDEIRFVRIVACHQGRLLHVPVATLRIQLQRDRALTAGRDCPVKLGDGEASPGNDLLDLEHAVSDVLDLETMHEIPIFTDQPEIMAGFCDLDRGSFGRIHCRGSGIVRNIRRRVEKAYPHRHLPLFRGLTLNVQQHQYLVVHINGKTGGARSMSATAEEQRNQDPHESLQIPVHSLIISALLAILLSARNSKSGTLPAFKAPLYAIGERL